MRWQVKETLRLQQEWERTRIVTQQEERRQSIVRGLAGELRDNLEIARNAHDGYSWAALSSSLWASTRGEFSFLPAKLQDLIRLAYIPVERYNNKLEDRRWAKDFGMGNWDNTIKDEITYFMEKAPQVIEQLENWFSQHELHH